MLPLETSDLTSPSGPNVHLRTHTLGRRAPDRSSPAFGTAPVGRVRPLLALPGNRQEKSESSSGGSFAVIFLSMGTAFAELAGRAFGCSSVLPVRAFLGILMGPEFSFSPSSIAYNYELNVLSGKSLL